MTTLSDARDERLDIGHGDLQILRGGQGPVLLVLLVLHDVEVMTDWQPYHARLAEQFTVLAPSHPGFGSSQRPEHIETIDDLAYFYLDFLATLGGTVNILGLGVGGWIAAEMCIRCCGRTRRLILADSVGIKASSREERDIVETFLLTRDQLLETGWHDPLLGAERMKLQGTPELTYEEVLMLARNREAAARYTWKPFMHNPKLRNWLHRITVPTLVLWGADDRVVTPNYGRAFAAAIPDARFQTIDAAGHYPYLERPEEFAAAVTKFLS